MALLWVSAPDGTSQYPEQLAHGLLGSNFPVRELNIGSSGMKGSSFHIPVIFDLVPLAQIMAFVFYWIGFLCV